MKTIYSTISILGMILLTLASCKDDNEYSYIEKKNEQSYIHSKLSCYKIEKGVSIIKTDDIELSEDMLFCPKCCNQNYISLLFQNSKDRNIIGKTHTAIDRERKKLFDALNAAGYDVGNYYAFDSKMNNDTERKKFFDDVNEAGYDIGDYEEFERRIAPNINMTAEELYRKLKRISDEERIDFGIDNYTEQSFKKRYFTGPGNVRNLYYKINQISQETGIDFGQGSEAEWMETFGYGRDGKNIAQRGLCK